MKKFLEKISTKIKIVLGVLAAIFGFILVLFVGQKLKAKEKMQYELTKVASELKTAELEQDSEFKKKKIADLKKNEELIREKIAYIEKTETTERREVSMEELDKFFDQRGF